MKYKVVRITGDYTELQNFEVDVQEYIKFFGWKLQGGINIIQIGTNSWQYAQAMIKEEPLDNDSTTKLS